MLSQVREALSIEDLAPTVAANIITGLDVTTGSTVFAGFGIIAVGIIVLSAFGLIGMGRDIY